MSLRTEPIKTDGYTLDVTESALDLNIRLTGTFDMTAAPDLSLFLASIEGEVRRLQTRLVNVDVVDVYYLGSACIKCVLALIEALKRIESRPRCRVIINPQRDWHHRTFSILARLAPTLVTLEKPE